MILIFSTCLFIIGLTLFYLSHKKHKENSTLKDDVIELKDEEASEIVYEDRERFSNLSIKLAFATIAASWAILSGEIKYISEEYPQKLILYSIIFLIITCFRFFLNMKHSESVYIKNDSDLNSNSFDYTKSWWGFFSKVLESVQNVPLILIGILVFEIILILIVK